MCSTVTRTHARTHERSSTRLQRLEQTGSLVAVILAALCWIPSCASVDDSSNNEPLDEVETATAPTPLTASEKEGEGVSANSIEVVWAETAPEHRGQAVRALLPNNTSHSISAELSLAGVSPRGEKVARALGRRTIKADSTLSLDIPVKGLPAQSAGMAAAVRLVASYVVQRYDFATGKPVEALQATTASTQLYVTSEETFRDATFRTEAAQAIHDSARFNSSRRLPQPTVRLWDRNLGAAVAASRAADEDGSTDGVQFIAVETAGDDRPTNLALDGHSEEVAP